MKNTFLLVVGLSMMIAGSASASLTGIPPQKTAPSHSIAGSELFADTAGQDNRQDRRNDRQDDRDDRSDDRQDCRQAEGAGKDKRDCKQDGRQDRNSDG